MAPSDHEEHAYGADEPRLLTVSLGERAYGIGRSLGEVDLGALGVEVTGIRRHASRMLEPTAESVFEAGDVVVLLASGRAGAGRGAAAQGLIIWQVEMKKPPRGRLLCT